MTIIKISSYMVGESSTVGTLYSYEWAYRSSPRDLLCDLNFKFQPNQNHMPNCNRPICDCGGVRTLDDTFSMGGREHIMKLNPTCPPLNLISNNKMKHKYG